MKKTVLFLSLFFFISYTSKANESFEFTKDCIKSFKLLNESTLIFVQKVQKAKNKKTVESLTMEYVSTLVEAQNILLKYTKSPDLSISEVASDLCSLMSDLVKENYSFLSTIKKSSSIKNICTDFIVKVGFITAYFGNISLGICSATIDSQIENPSTELQYSKLTRKQRDEINQLLIDSFGKSIIKGQSVQSETGFEASCKIIYEFFNLEWEFSKE